MQQGTAARHARDNILISLRRGDAERSLGLGRKMPRARKLDRIRRQPTYRLYAREHKRYFWYCRLWMA